jgi:CRISPR-associated protein Csm4
VETFAVYLEPRGPLASSIGSDTLFGAACWALRLLGTDLKALLEKFDPPRFAFSSAFPCRFASGKQVRFYPWPRTLGPTPMQVEAWTQELSLRMPARKATLEAAAKAKRLRDTEYLSESLLKEVAAGQTDAPALLRRLKELTSTKGDVQRAGRLLYAHGEIPPQPALMAEDAVQHNHIDRLAGATVEGLLYYLDETSFAEGAGLWCLVRCSAADLNNLLRPALRLLEDTGLGRDRTSGRGHFRITVDTKPFPLPGPANGNGWLNLSRYLPHQSELPALDRGGPLAYRLQTLWPKRERRLAPSPGGPLFKQRLRVFTPGSVFPTLPDRPIRGRLVPIDPPEEAGFTIYHSGLAVGLPLHAAGGAP